jgi:predicted CoA-binding protein
MTSSYEQFWERKSFAVVGHSAKRKFPVLTYRGLKKLGKQVVPVDPSAVEIDGDRAVRSLGELPGPVEAAVLEVPPNETAEAVRQAAASGIRSVWIHQTTDTPEALAAAKEKGLNVLHGNCAVQYVNCTSYHRIHRWLWRLLGKY